MTFRTHAPVAPSVVLRSYHHRGAERCSQGRPFDCAETSTATRGGSSAWRRPGDVQK